MKGGRERVRVCERGACGGGGEESHAPPARAQGRAEPRPIRLEGTPQQLEWVKQVVSDENSFLLKISL